MSTAPVRSAFLSGLMAVSVLTGCSAGSDLGYDDDYSQHEPLAVVGYPSRGTLEITQRVVWGIADGKAGELAALGTDGEPRKTAENWIAAFGQGARGKVTADFYDSGSTRQVVVLYFHDTSQIKELQVRTVGDDGWRVVMGQPDPEDATAAYPWVPKKPGELGSRREG
ncbi:MULTISPECIES: hypothetical protein [Streptomyces]|uniref:hypothetical protein n=1 Tax=Streptomyces TaxID=1883 RepID=UPI00131EA04A|nr:MULTISPECIES: hypothetical protein [unclassified Streptomyces]